MSDVQPPIIVLEGSTGVSAFLTPSEATGHNWRGSIPADMPLPPRESFDGSGRLLREDPSSGLQVESQEDHSEYVRSQALQRLRQALENSDLDLQLTNQARVVLERFLQQSPADSREFAETLAELVRPPKSPWLDPTETVGGYWHYKCSPHH